MTKLLGSRTAALLISADVVGLSSATSYIHLSLGSRLVLGLLIAGTIGACQAEAPAPSPTEPLSSPLSTRLTISSDVHAFNIGELRAPAAQDLELHYLNRSPVPHNVAIYSDASARVALYVGEIITEGQAIYQIPALPPGLYFFRCDVHPVTMQGRLSVE